LGATLSSERAIFGQADEGIQRPLRGALQQPDDERKSEVRSLFAPALFEWTPEAWDTPHYGQTRTESAGQSASREEGELETGAYDEACGIGEQFEKQELRGLDVSRVISPTEFCSPETCSQLGFGNHAEEGRLVELPLAEGEHSPPGSLVHFGPMKFGKSLYLLRQKLAHFCEFVTVGAAKFDVGATLPHPNSTLPRREMFCKKRQEAAGVHERSHDSRWGTPGEGALRQTS
jgi:hypothetical protein